MNCFQVIKSVLDEAYQEIPGSQTKRDAEIVAALKDLRLKYRSIVYSGCIEYGDPVKRFAYLYCYTTMHANLVYDICQRSPKLRTLLKLNTFNMAAVGGGPGSDFLGIIKCCEEESLTPRIRLQIFDRDPAWGESWLELDAKLKGTLSLTKSFQTLDVTDPSTWSQFKKHLKVDLVTLVYFMSEVYAKKKEADPYFQNLFANLKPGALVIFIDNNDSRIYGWLDDLAERNGYTFLRKEETNETMPGDEQLTDLGDYVKRFGKPRLKANRAYRLVQKK